MTLPLQDANTGELPPVACGGSLPGPFYSGAGILQTDVAMLGATQWLFVDHASRIPRPGDSPGPHSLHETRISDFLAWYHGQLQRARTR